MRLLTLLVTLLLVGASAAGQSSGPPDDQAPDRAQGGNETASPGGAPAGNDSQPAPSPGGDPSDGEPAEANRTSSPPSPNGTAAGNGTSHNAGNRTGPGNDLGGNVTTNGTSQGPANGTASNHTVPEPVTFCAQLNCTADLLAAALPNLEHIAFSHEGGLELTNYSVDGDVLLQGLTYQLPANASFTARAEDHRLAFSADGNRIALHDTSSGLILFEGDGQLRLVLPPGAELQRTAFGARFVLQDYQVMLLSRSLTPQSDGTLLATGDLSIIKRPAEPPQRQVIERPATDQPLIDDAVGRKHLGAEVSVELANETSVLTYDELNVTVQVPEAPATPEDPIRIEVSAELAEGRAVAVTIDPARLRGDELQLRYFNIHELADGTRLESELIFPLADDLQDALDPTNDGGQPEYWVVRDQNGIQAILVFPHWSVHAVTIAGIDEVELKPNLVLGAMLGLMAASVAGFVLFRPRRE